jgi:hypothetical protein
MGESEAVMSKEKQKIPKWVKNGARLRVFEDRTVTTVMENGWVWMESDDGRSRIARHVSQLGKSFVRLVGMKKARRP